MHIYLDSADVNAWNEILPFGFINSVTTNPLLFQKSSLEYKPEVFESLRSTLDSRYPLYIQVVGDTYEAMEASAEEIIKLQNVRVKIPYGPDGIKLGSKLRYKGIYVLLTGLYTAEQCGIAAASGFQEVAVYYNRMINEYGDQGPKIIKEIAAFSAKDAKLKVLLASLKTTQSVAELMAMGFDRFTLSPELIREMINHPFSLRDAEEFNLASLPKISQD